MTVADGHVVRFVDSVDKLRPGIVLDVRKDEFVIVLEGTTKGHWRDDGERVLMEVRGETRIAARMGLKRDVTTYFYGSRRRLKFVPLANIRVRDGSPATCPPADLREMQNWAFGVLEEARAAPGTERRGASETESGATAAPQQVDE